MPSAKKSLKNDARRLVPPKNDKQLTLADVLRDARLSRHLSQEELARKLGLRQRQISDLERATVDARLSTIQNVARALDLELMLIPRQLISAVEGLQRAGRDSAKRPMYALDDEDAETHSDDQSHIEVGSTDESGAPTARERRWPKEPQ